MGGRLEVVCGIAGSGKTARLLDLYRREQARLLQICSPGEAVWITPTARSRREVVRRLLDTSLRACLAPNVLTFDAFAERLLHTAGSEITPLSPVARRMIARAVIDEAQDAGSLPYFSPIAQTSGFLDLFLDFVSELKRDETWPEHFEKACRERGWPPREAELSLLYGRYQDRLNTLSLYDAEGRFWSARSALADGRRGAFETLSLVIVDGFADFTQPQYEILKHLAGYAERAIVTLPLDEPRVRTELFAKSATALHEINRISKPMVTCLQPPADKTKGAAASFRHIAENLFDNPRTLRQLAEADGLEIIEAAGPTGEARALAERIKKLLLDGVAADQIVVAIRGASDEWSALEEMFTAAGIPYACQMRMPFSRTPLARTLFAVLQAELDDWQYDGLCAVLRSNYFRPLWSSAQAGRAAKVTPQVLRKWKLGSDRRRILKRLTKTVEESLPAHERAVAERADATTALALLKKLSAATDRLRQPATFGEWVDRAVSLCDELGISPPNELPADARAESVQPRVDTDLDERDREHWRRLKDVLYDAAETLALLEDDRELDLAAFVRRLRDILDSQEFAVSESPAGKVQVLEAADVRNLEVPHLFLAGLSEASFPRSRQDDCLYTEADRRRFVRKGHAGTGEHAASPSTQQQDEMLLFYSIVTRARRGLTLSYPSVSAAGQPLFSSPYVAALRSLFAPAARCVTAYGDLDPVPTRERTLTVADLRLVATEEVRERRGSLFRLLAGSCESAAAARSIVASAEMAAARFEQAGFTPYEGRLTREANVRRVAELFPRDLQFSATQLQAYASCPFRFLLSQVLKIEPQEQAEVEVDPRARGLSLHRILKNLHAPSLVADRASGLPGGAQPNGAQIGQLLRDLAAEQFVLPADCTPFERAVQTVERRFAELFAEWYAAQWDAYRAALGAEWDDPLAPRFVELPFGDVPRRNEVPHPQAQPFATFGTGPDRVRVQGQIDRIDVGRRGPTTTFAVIDYKTRSGQRFDLADVRAGLALQLAIYVSAIRQSQLLGPEPGLFQMLYWNLTRNGCVPAFKAGRGNRMEPFDAGLVAEIESSLHDLLPRMTARIRSGDFPVYSADQGCTGYCPYNTVCRVNQVRSIEQERNKVWNLSLP